MADRNIEQAADAAEPVTIQPDSVKHGHQAQEQEEHNHA